MVRIDEAFTFASLTFVMLLSLLKPLTVALLVIYSVTYRTHPIVANKWLPQRSTGHPKGVIQQMRALSHDYQLLLTLKSCLSGVSLITTISAVRFAHSPYDSRNKRSCTNQSVHVAVFLENYLSFCFPSFALVEPRGLLDNAGLR